MITLNLTQARQLVEFFGGCEQTIVAVDDVKDGHSGTGLYAWCEDYPEEGSVLLADGKTPKQAAEPAAEPTTEV